jgi:nitrite reductase/ring-hydroxylating ferredoxin subunit
MLSTEGTAEMSDDARNVVGRRELLVLCTGAAAIPACGGSVGVASSGDGGSGGGSSSGQGSGSDSGSDAWSGGGNDDGSTSSDGSSSSSSSSGGSSGSGSSSGGPTCPTSGKVLTLSFAQYPSLMSAGGSVVVAANGYLDPNCQKNQIVVVCKATGQYVALSTSCTDMCCAVSFVSAMAGFRCPCHGATFDITGKSTSFLAALPLPSLPICADATGVYVTMA